MSHIDIAKRAFLQLAGTQKNGLIPVSIRPLSTTGTVQDDPFDEWFGNFLTATMTDCEVIHSGPLTTPDIILRDLRTREIIGIEVKKIDQNHKGKDSRGLTLDYNSCIPCGQMQIKIGGQVSRIKTYYFFGLLSNDKNSLISSCLMDGDFLNYDFDLHMQGKYQNTSQYGHGPYGEGSVRGRAMYLYPNPMNVSISTFHKKHTFVIKEEYSYQIRANELNLISRIERTDLKNNTVTYTQYSTTPSNSIETVRDIFGKCKERSRKERQPYLTEIGDAPPKYSPKTTGEF